MNWHINPVQRILFSAGCTMVALHVTYYPHPVMLVFGVVIASFFYPGNDGEQWL